MIVNQVHKLDFSLLGIDQPVPSTANSLYFIAFNDDADLVGYLNFEVLADSLKIIYIETFKKYGNQGVAYKLLQHLMNFCSSSGIRKLEVTQYTPEGSLFLAEILRSLCAQGNFSLIEESELSAAELIARYNRIN